MNPQRQPPTSYIYFSDPVEEENRKKKSGFQVEKSSEGKPSLLFNMQPLDVSSGGLHLSSGLFDGLMAGNRGDLLLWAGRPQSRSGYL